MGFADYAGKAIFLVGWDKAYVTAEAGGGAHLFHTRLIDGSPLDHREPSSWEAFTLVQRGGKWALRCTFSTKYYVSAEPSGVVVANRLEAGDWENWDIQQLGTTDDGGYIVTLKSHHGKYLCAENGGAIVANRSAVGGWEQFKLYKYIYQAPGYRSWN